MRTRSIKWTLLGVAAAVVIALPGLAPGKTKKSAAVPAPPAEVSAAVPGSANYVIGPGDLLDVSVWQNADLSFKGLPVRPDGKISIPLLNDVQAAGLTAMQLSNAITAGLKSFVKDPQVTVVVAQVNSQRYYVLGEVAHPGAFPLLPGTTALQAIATAGGFTQFANEKKIYILRQGQKLPFNYKQVVAGKDLQENIDLKPGDTVMIP
ncbi:MAG: polysaccharide biosynthesis/export family protein [Terriglobia bacterium]